jgi:O-antigen/teichoic acid export membrane protein
MPMNEFQEVKSKADLTPCPSMPQAKSYNFLKNSAFTTLGWLVPILVNFITVPIIVHNLGYDAYGVWVLVMAVMGYFALLDLGVAKGGIKFLAEANARGDISTANQVVSIGLVFYCAIGLVGGVGIALSVDTFLLDFIKTPEALKPTARIVFYLAAFGFFVTMLQTYLLSLPQALHRFDISNTVDSVNQIVISVITVLVVVVGFGLISVIVVRVIGNILCCISLVHRLKKCMPSLNFSTYFRWKLAKSVFSYSLISFIGRVGTTTATQLQTIIVGSLLGTTAVAVFSIPFTLISRVMGISSRLSMLIFPVSSELSGDLNMERLHEVYLTMTRNLFFLSVVQVVVFVLFSWEILRVWMGAEFADKASIILVMVAIGYFFDTLTNLPSQVCDGLGHPRITSIFAFIRGIVGILLTLVGGYILGVQGVAAGYMLSCIIVSALFNFYVHQKVIMLSYMGVMGHYAESALFGTLIFGLFFSIQNDLATFSLARLLIELSGVSFSFALIGYFRIIDVKSRRYFNHLAGQMFSQMTVRFR